jgi:hypothetical protein
MAKDRQSITQYKTTVEIPGEVEIEEAIQEKIQEVDSQGKPVEIEMTDEGGAEVSFDPAIASPEGGEDHYSNLAEFLDDDVLDKLGAKLTDDYRDYRNSRKDWEDSYREGLDLLGFKYERRTEPFRGASGVTHPVLS